MAPRRQPQAQPTRALQANTSQPMAHKGKGPIMQAIPRKQARPVQQRRWIEPTQPQRHGKTPMYAQGQGMIPYFIPTCHFCGFDGHIRPRCFRYIKMCKTRSMIEKKKKRAMKHVPRNDKIDLHDPRTSRAYVPQTTRKENVLPR